MHSLVAYAAEEAAPNPLLPAWYDIIWSAVCFVIILIVEAAIFVLVVDFVLLLTCFFLEAHAFSPGSVLAFLHFQSWRDYQIRNIPG